VTIALAPRLFPVHQTTTTSDDYYTPSWVFERMGITFDLDVCAPSGGIPWIPAARYLDPSDDGLAQPWDGRVWMNPPYSNVTPWVNRFVAHRNGVAFVPFARSRWLNVLWDESDALVVPENVGSFAFANGKTMMFPIYLAAIGPECVEAISRLGRVR
jgi:hypothetical protein